MASLIAVTLATVVQSVPDTGATALLAGLSLLSLGVAARFFKNRKK
jgi:hypothetical protein